jgi:hypothetical protein
MRDRAQLKRILYALNVAVLPQLSFAFNLAAKFLEFPFNLLHVRYACVLQLSRPAGRRAKSGECALGVFHRIHFAFVKLRN